MDILTATDLLNRSRSPKDLPIAVCLPMKMALEREFVCLAFLAEFLKNTVEKQISLGREVTDNSLVSSKSNIILAFFSLGTN